MESAGLKLTFWERAPPLAAVAAARAAAVELDAKADPKLTKDSAPILHLPHRLGHICLQCRPM
jgi:hypothetical protein